MYMLRLACADIHVRYCTAAALLFLVHRRIVSHTAKRWKIVSMFGLRYAPAQVACVLIFICVRYRACCLRYSGAQLFILLESTYMLGLNFSLC